MDNQRKINPDKCHFICSTNGKVNLIVENQMIDNSKCEKLLGVKFDYKLTFNAHIDDTCKKAGLKLNALSRIAPYKDFNKKRLLVNMFFMSQFNYCPLIWVCLSDLFPLRQAHQYNLRNRSQFIIPNVKTVNHRFESLRYLGPKIWETIPSHLREIDSLKNFKMSSKNGNENCVHVGSTKYIFKT